MKLKLILASMIALLFVLPGVLATNLLTDKFYVKGTADALNGVDEIIFTCNDVNCVTVNQLEWFSVNSGTTNAISVQFPNNANPVNYARYFYKEGYLPLAFKTAAWGTWQDKSYNKYFEKGENCKAPIDSFVMVNSVYANEPMAVDVKAKLSAETYSAFKDAGMPPYYVPDAYKDEFYSAETEVTLKVYNPAGELVDSETRTVNIYMDTSETVQFNWIPTEAGEDYRAEVMTVVVDEQCNSETAETVATDQEFDVLPARPTDECYVLLNDLSLSDVTPQVNQEITVSYNKISNYADLEHAKTAVPVNARYIISKGRMAKSGDVVSDDSTVIEATSTDTPAEFSFKWTPDEEGWYTISVNGRCDSNLCLAKANHDATANIETYVSPIPVQDVIFTVTDRDSGANIDGVAIGADGKGGITDGNGVAVLSGFEAGTYTYEAMHPEYHETSGEFEVGNVDLYVNIQMTYKNEVPHINLDSIEPLNIDEGNSIMLDFSEFVFDDDNTDDELVLAYSGANKAGITVDGMSVKFSTTKGVLGTDAITFTVTDPEGASASDTMSVSVDNVNDAPVIEGLPDIALNEGENKWDAFNLNDYASDIETPDNMLTYTLSANNCGTVLDQFDNVDVNPAIDFNGVCAVTATVSDGELTDTDMFAVIVNSVNDAPDVFLPGVITIPEDGMSSWIALDMYAEDDSGVDALTWSYTGNVNVYVDSGAGNTIRFRPVANWNGEETITFTATDSEGASDSDPVNIKVTSVNDAPVVDLPEVIYLMEDGFSDPIDLDDYVNDIETPDDQIVWSYSGNVHISVQGGVGNVIIFVPEANWNGEETITFTATDSEGASDSDPVNIKVTSVNDAPVVEITHPDEEHKDFVEDSNVNLMVSVTDVDSNPPFTYVVDYGDGTTESADIIWENSFSTSHTYSEPGDYVITVTVYDEQGGNGEDSVGVTIWPHAFDIPVLKAYNEPTFTQEDYSFYRSEAVYIGFTVVDTNDNSVKVPNNINSVYIYNKEHPSQIVDLTAFDNGNTIINGQDAVPDGDYYYYLPSIPLNDDLLGWNIVFVFSHDNAGAGQKELEIEILNNEIVLSDIPDVQFDVDETLNDAFDLDDYVSDVETPDSEILWTVSGNEHVHYAVDDVEHTVDFWADAGWNGVETLTFTADDTDGSVKSDTVVVTVNINEAPVVKITHPDEEHNRFVVNHDMNLIVSVTDVDSEDLYYNINFGDMSPLVSGWVEDNEIFLIHQYQNVGNFEIHVSVSDGKGVGTDSVVVDIWDHAFDITDLKAYNDPEFSVEDDEFYRTETLYIGFSVVDINDGSVKIPNNINDVYMYNAENPSQIVDLTAFDNGNTIINGQDAVPDGDYYYYLPSIPLDDDLLGWNVVFVFSHDIDGAGQKTLNIKILNNELVLSDIPDVEMDVDEVVEDAFGTLDNYVSDLETPDEEIVWTVSGNEHVHYAVDDVEHTVDFWADAGWNGVETLTFTADDTDGSTASDNVVVYVGVTPGSPIVNVPDITFNEGETYVLNLDDYVIEPDGQDVIWSYSGNTNVIINIGSDGSTATLSAAAGWIGAETITFTATDTDGLSNSDESVVTVADVTHAPQITSIPVTAATADVPYTYDADAADADGDVLTYSLTSGPAGMTVNSANGVINWVPHKEDIGNHDISIMVSDGALTDTQSFVLVVSQQAKPTADEEDLMVAKLQLVTGDFAEPGDVIEMTIGVENVGDIKLKDVKAVALIPELGIRSRAVGFDNLDKGDAANRRIALDIPEDAKEGEYSIRVVISNDKFRRVKYRNVIIR